VSAKINNSQLVKIGLAFFHGFAKKKGQNYRVAGSSLPASYGLNDPRVQYGALTEELTKQSCFFFFLIMA
jgi:hypothetical protein